jgi:hypothetical protein
VSVSIQFICLYEGGGVTGIFFTRDSTNLFAGKKRDSSENCSGFGNESRPGRGKDQIAIYFFNQELGCHNFIARKTGNGTPHYMYSFIFSICI